MNKILPILVLSAMFFGGQGSLSAVDESVETEDESSSDWQITLKVKSAILADGSLSPSNRFVSVSTTDGVVTITGKVSDRYQRTEIVKKAESVAGVKKVVDKMTIGD
ncbi:MAG: BON domain-containing protein [Chlamydiota bacterium]